MTVVACFGLPLFTGAASSPWIERRSPLLHAAIDQPEYLLYSSVSSNENLPAGQRGFGKATISDASKKPPARKPKRQNGNGEEDDDEIPQVVFDRMIARIVFYVGVPMALGIGFIYLFQYLKQQQVWDVPFWLPFLTTLVSFGSSALGIAYGTLSASWDPNKKGSLFGWEEVQQNWPELWREEEDEL